MNLFMNRIARINLACVMALWAASITLTSAAPAPKPVQAPPSAPFIRPPEPVSHWRIIIRPQPRPAAASADAEGSPRAARHPGVSIDLVRSVPLQKCTVAVEGAPQREYWHWENLVLVPTQVPGRFVCTDVGPSGSRPYMEYSDSFVGADWVALENYVSSEVKEGRTIHYYVLKEAVPAAPNNAAVASEPIREAWIDAETLWPIKAQMGEMIYTYEKLAPPAAPLQLPAEQSKALETLKKEQAFLKRVKENR